MEDCAFTEPGSSVTEAWVHPRCRACCVVVWLIPRDLRARQMPTLQMHKSRLRIALSVVLPELCPFGLREEGWEFSGVTHEN
jgi:hypothetical protein